jgi:hypothetical protein
MRSSATRSATTAALAAILILIAGSDVEPAAAGNSLLQAAPVSISGSTVRVTIVNPGPDAATATVLVRAVVKNRVTQASRTVTVAGGGTTAVDVDFDAPVKGIITAGVILDDGAPF